MATKTKVLYDETLNFDGVDYHTKITKPTPDSPYMYQIKTAVTVNGKKFVDYSTHCDWGTASYDNDVLSNQVYALSGRIERAFPTLDTMKWRDKMFEFYAGSGIFY